MGQGVLPVAVAAGSPWEGEPGGDSGLLLVLSHVHTFCCDSVGGRKPRSTYCIMLRLVRLHGPGRVLGGFAGCFSEADGVPMPEAGSKAGIGAEPAVMWLVPREGGSSSGRRAASEVLPPVTQRWAVEYWLSAAGTSPVPTSHAASSAALVEAVVSRAASFTLLGCRYLSIPFFKSLAFLNEVGNPPHTHF